MFSNNGSVLQHKETRKRNEKTFKRHLTYDTIFLIENTILATFGFLLSIHPTEEQNAKNYTIIISCVAHVFGIFLKVLYYAKLHVWSDLNIE